MDLTVYVPERIDIVESSPKYTGYVETEWTQVETDEQP